MPQILHDDGTPWAATYCHHGNIVFTDDGDACVDCPKCEEEEKEIAHFLRDLCARSLVPSARCLDFSAISEFHEHTFHPVWKREPIEFSQEEYDELMAEMADAGDDD